MQEAYRKDVEQAFGVLQSRYTIIQYPGRLWDQAELTYIMKTVIILHNMTVEDEEASEFEGNYEYNQLARTQDSIFTNKEPNLDFESFLLRYKGLCNIQLHNQLKEDLIEHLWNHLGTEAAE